MTSSARGGDGKQKESDVVVRVKREGEGMREKDWVVKRARAGGRKARRRETRARARFANR